MHHKNDKTATIRDLKKKKSRIMSRDRMDETDKPKNISVIYD